MKTALSVMIAACLLAGCATSTVIYPNKAAFAKASPALPGWVARDPYDQKNFEYGYVRVTAKIVTVSAIACMTPGYANNFRKDKIDIVVSAIPRGFVNVDEVEVPLYQKHLVPQSPNVCVDTNSEILLVPNSVIRSDQLAKKISVIFRYNANREESLSYLADPWISAAGALTTGGAAQTVAGLTNLATGKAVQRAGDYYKSITSNASESPVEAEINWSDIADGKNEITVPVWQTETKPGYENASDAATDAAANGREKKLLFNIVFHLEFQRTLFGVEPTTSPYMPDKDTFSDDTVLQFPPGAGVTTLNLLQRLNAKTPTVSQNLSQKDPAVYLPACQEARSIIGGLPLSKYDRAIVMTALLNSARPGWNNEAKFVNQCLKPFNYVELINAIYRNSIPNFPADVPKYLELPEGADKEWAAIMAPLLEDLSMSFPQIEDVVKLRLAAFIDPTTKIWVEPADWSPALIALEKTQQERLAELARPRVRNVGCYLKTNVEHEEDANKNVSGTFIMLLENNSKYKVRTEFDKATRKLLSISISHLDTSGSIDNAITGSRYSPASRCAAIYRANSSI